MYRQDEVTMRKTAILKLAVMITAASMVSSLLLAPPAVAVDTAQTSQNDSETAISLTESEGQWARQYAAEMLEKYPKLQTNPYAVLAKFTSDASTGEINQLLSEIGARNR